ncbi:bifunctional DNA-binding transcriptional regulator/O6-methylguanine-DNA methyltransferase Ada [Solimonas soli]|uniref:bifunctional DNA-binding transcriptional regulator/O6-methylguanine-DNA methyltransferase Ada n=1 Tax=Solimonas soli TaxID=413479 RepID=UPI00048533DC|nr:bifunctional DNA-binding transcriptional regulator/O6-methylguanine-DNA methyltransferase Ada [Solimonas soli]
MNQSTNQDEQRWQAVQARDATQDGRFWYGVRSTGVYCKPSCASRQPLRRNVRFYDSAEAAERDGLRPCKRCKPRDAAGDGEAARIAAVCRHIETHAGEKLPLAELARRAALSPFHFQRRFKAIVGLSPKEYAQACRLKTLRRELRAAASVSDAIYGAGYGSGSRVYENIDSRLGMTPAEYRAGGEGVAISYASGRTPLGLVMIGATDRGICFLQFGDDEAALLDTLRAEYPAARPSAMPPAQQATFDEWMRRLGEHLEGRRPNLDLPLDTRGTAFQLEVWKYLQTIPYGELRSYTEVAAAIGRPAAVRAVARACATNTIALLIPCHRVIRGDGSLSGYRWGLARKRVLIDRERAHRGAQ